jgi:site-specific recombinase XerD
VQESSLADLIASWVFYLDAERKSPKTIEAYLRAATELDRFFADGRESQPVSELKRQVVERYLIATRQRTSASTAATRYRALKQFFRWLVDVEGELEKSPMQGLRMPKLDERPVFVIPEDQVAALFDVLKGRRDFASVRDRAILRVFLNTGIRVGEMVGLRLVEVELRRKRAVVKGKGNKTREVPLGPKAVLEIDRYLRARRGHPLASEPWLWLGSRGRLTDSGVTQMLRRRCQEAGVPAVNPHRWRHTMSHYFLAAGGSEHDLAALHGWTSTQMVQRYAKSTAVDRAMATHERISPGDHL